MQAARTDMNVDSKKDDTSRTTPTSNTSAKPDEKSRNSLTETMNHKQFA